MIVSYRWLAAHFTKELPPVEEVVDLLNAHIFEVESVEQKNDDFVLDIDVLPNRAHDCLSHRGIAREIGVLIDTPAGSDTAVDPTPAVEVAESVGELTITLDKKGLCRRYIGRRIEGVRVGPSPDWLRERLESVGQRSINNIVDITNYVMLELGQPLHAFDADKLEGGIQVRSAHNGETITTLDGDDVSLDESVLVIADDTAPLAIAGIKGGVKAEIDESTQNIILEAANFSPVNIRFASRRVGIQNDSSKRFEHDITPELASSAASLATALIARYAAGEDLAIGEYIDVYPRKSGSYKTGFSVDRVNEILGTKLSLGDVEAIMRRLGLDHESVDPVERVLSLAPTLVGVPYKHGASITYDAPGVFDCSSFIAYLFAQGGLSIPRMAADQMIYGTEVDEKDMILGDVVFSNTGDGKITYETTEWLPGTKIATGVDHCGLYLGDGKIIHATRATGEVVIEPLATAGQFKNIVGVRRMSEAGKKRFVVSVPPERLDLRREEDLIEEVGRVYGYRNITATDMQENTGKDQQVNALFFYANKVRNILAKEGFSEVYTYSFENTGEVEIKNPLAGDKGYVRKDLSRAMREVLKTNERFGDLLGVDDVRIFEISTVFRKDGEHTSLCIGRLVRRSYQGKDKKAIKHDHQQALAPIMHILSDRLGVTISPRIEAIDQIGAVTETNFEELIKDLPVPNDYDNTLTAEISLDQFAPISPYPFIVRDIAVFVPPGMEADGVATLIRKHAGSLLAREPKLFDVFEKKDANGSVEKVSYAFRMVFQSHEKTLTDGEVNDSMDKITVAMKQNGWEVR